MQKGMALMKCGIAIALMHEYLDEAELTHEQTKRLQAHLDACPDCRQRFESLERTDALIRALPTPRTPEDLADRILRSLPKTRKPRAWTTWVRRHPAASAAALFVLVMLSSFVAMWNQSQQLSVSGSDLEHVVIQGHTVIVPAGQKVSGDLTIENGTAQVLGEVQGNLTVIDGNVALASTARIAGKVKTIDRAVDWVWYKVTSWFGSLAYSS